jgi:hypothetical protein
MRMVIILDRWPLPALTSPLAPLQAITYFRHVLHVKGRHFQGEIDFKVDINRLAEWPLGFLSGRTSAQLWAYWIHLPSRFLL